MAPDSKGSAGFVLPQPVDATQTPSAGPAAPNVASETAPVIAPGLIDTSSRDLLVGGALLLVLFVAFFFAKNAYANMLVSKRIPHAKANASGWWLLIFLVSLASGVVLVAINAAKFMAPLIIGPLGVVALLALILMLISGRK